MCERASHPYAARCVKRDTAGDAWAPPDQAPGIAHDRRDGWSAAADLADFTVRRQ